MNDSFFESAKVALAKNPTEAQVEKSVVFPLLKLLGYQEKNIFSKVKVRVKAGSKKFENLTCDVLAKDDKLPTLIVESKSPTRGLVLPEDYNQGMSYCFSPDVKTTFLFLTSGYSNRLYSSHQLFFEYDLKNIFANAEDFRKHLLGEIDPKKIKPFSLDIENFFIYSHNRMFGEDAIKPAEALHIITKLSLIKTNEERGRSLYNLRTILDYEDDYNNVKTSPTKKKHIEDSIYRYLSDCLKNVPTDLLYPEEKTISRNISVSVLFDIIKKLYGYTLDYIPTERKGSAFDSFLNNTLKGKELGQFFTHRNIVQFMVAMSNLQLSSRVIDPACGTGGFIETAFIDLRGKLKKFYPEDSDDYKKKLEQLQNNQIFGIEKDGSVASLGKLSMSMNGDGHTTIIKANGLSFIDERIRESSFDVVLTNPPFGSKSVVQIKDKQLLSLFELGKQYRYNNQSKRFEPTGAILEGQDIGVLFLERCIKLLKPHGLLGIILHDGVFSNSTNGHIRQYIRENCRIVAVIKLSDETFKPYSDGGGTETTILFCKKEKEAPENLCFFAVANKVGYRYKRKTIHQDHNDLPEIFKAFTNGKNHNTSRWVRLSQIPLNFRIDPQFHCQKIRMGSLKFELLGDLISTDTLLTGFPFESKYFGTGTKRLVKIAHINSSLLNLDDLETIPEDYYAKCNAIKLKEGDILLAMDGKKEFRASYIDKDSTDLAVNQRVAIIRIDQSKLPPAYVFFVLNSKIGQKQLMREKTQTATVAHLSPTLIKSVKIPLFSKEQITKIEKDFNAYVSSKRESEKAFDKISNAF